MVCPPAKNVSFKKDGRATVGQKPAAFRLDGKHRPYLGRSYSEPVSCFVESFLV
jgi:hypothetical protein